MNNPVISVILPVYNATAFLKPAIQSILDQTFGDFELLIINDGSTDDSEKEILSFKDERINYLANTTNHGLVYSLNLGIEKSRGKYIARMDADDICLRDRFQLQKEFLDAHPDTAIVASTIHMIDEGGKDAGFWALDRRTITAKEIRKAMPWQNCIAHPSVMGKTAVFKQYRYNPAQAHIEDYDLWLRLLAGGERIEKISVPLISYRVHSTSITATELKRKNFFFRHIRTKQIFAVNEIRKGKLNGIVLKVLFTAGIDFIKGIAKSFKKS